MIDPVLGKEIDDAIDVFGRQAPALHQDLPKHQRGVRVSAFGQRQAGSVQQLR